MGSSRADKGSLEGSVKGLRCSCFSGEDPCAEDATFPHCFLALRVLGRLGLWGGRLDCRRKETYHTSRNRIPC